MTVRIALVGIGKIARDQHLPALASSPAFDLVVGVARHDPPADLPCWPSLDALLDDGPEIAAVSLCTPPVGRHALALRAIEAGLHVMLEKPPGATVCEVEQLAAAATAKGVSLFATWHSREAPAVEPARTWLADKQITSVAIRWREDVRRWHPGQAWIWKPGGLGVFDPGINALSVITAILPRPLMLLASDLLYPSNRAAPIAARLTLRDDLGTPVTADFDWRQQGEQIWEIMVETDAGPLHLSGGGARLQLAGETVAEQQHAEYPGLYRRFAELIDDGRSDVDLAPFKLVADAFMLGRRHEVEALND